MEEIKLVDPVEQIEIRKKRLQSIVQDIASKTRAIMAAGMILGMNGDDAESQTIDSSPKDKGRIESVERVQTEAEKILASFPKEIPGAESITVEKIEGAKKVLVFIKQNHLLPDFEDRENQRMNPAEAFWELYDVDRNQRDIAKIVKYLKAKFGVDRLYAELVTEENEKDIEEWLSTEGGKDELVNQTISPYMKYIFSVDTIPVLTEKFEYAVGADKILESQGLVDMESADTKKGLESMTQDVLAIQKKYPEKDGKFDESAIPEVDRWKWKKMFDDREDIFLNEILSKDKSAISATMFGYSHNFSPNVMKWNEENQDNKFSLVTIETKRFHYTPVYTALIKNGFNDEDATWAEFAFRELAIKLADGEGFDEAKFNQGKLQITGAKLLPNLKELSEDKIEKAVEIIKGLK